MKKDSGTKLEKNKIHSRFVDYKVFVHSLFTKWKQNISIHKFCSES